MVLPHRPQAVIFDMDGLLLDSESVWFDALLDLSSSRDLGPIDAEFARQFVGLPWMRVRSMLVDALGSDELAVAFREDWHAAYRQRIGAGPALKPGVTGILDLLDTMAVPLALATGSARTTVEHHLGHHGLLARFPLQICADDCEAGKPDPEPYLKAAMGLGIPAGQCLALEDSPNGVLSASRAGMSVICIPDMLQPTEEIASHCLAVADDLVQVADWLREHH